MLKQLLVDADIVTCMAVASCAKHVMCAYRWYVDMMPPCTALLLYETVVAGLPEMIRYGP